MPKIILYFTPGSPPARAVLLLLRELDIDVEIKTLDLMVKREQHSEEFLKLNPAHEVPTLVEGDFVLTESRAILGYLVNSRKPGNNLYPTEPKARAVVDQRLSYDHVLFAKFFLFIRLIFAGTPTPSPQARDVVVEILRVIDSFLKKGKWVAGDNLTIADFSAVTIITTIVKCGYDLNKLPNLHRWYTQCHNLKGFEENSSGAAFLASFIKGKADGPLF